MTTNPTIEIAETREQCTEPNADYVEQWDADFGCKCMYQSWPPPINYPTCSPFCSSTWMSLGFFFTKSNLNFCECTPSDIYMMALDSEVPYKCGRVELTPVEERTNQVLAFDSEAGCVRQSELTISYTDTEESPPFVVSVDEPIVVNEAVDPDVCCT